MECVDDCNKSKKITSTSSYSLSNLKAKMPMIDDITLTIGVVAIVAVGAFVWNHVRRH
jgi:hypothetical protein